MVVGPVRGDSHSAGGLRFGLKNIDGKSGVVPVVYHGDNPPPLFKVGRNVVVSGSYANGRARGQRHRHEVPVEVHADEARRSRWLISAARRSSSASGCRCYALVAGRLAAVTNRRRLAVSARNALFARFGSTLVAATVLATALVRHDFSFVVRRRAHEPHAADARTR